MSKTSALAAGQTSIAFREQSQGVLLIKEKNRTMLGLLVMTEDTSVHILALNVFTPFGMGSVSHWCWAQSGSANFWGLWAFKGIAMNL